MFSCTSTCYFLVHSCKATGCSDKNSSHPPSGTRSPNPTQPRPPASRVCKRGSLASPQDCPQYIVPGGGALDPAVWPVVQAAPAYWKFVQLYSQIRYRTLRLINKKKASVQKSIDLFCTLQTNVAHGNPNHSLRHTFVDRFWISTELRGHSQQGDLLSWEEHQC